LSLDVFTDGINRLQPVRDPALQHLASLVPAVLTQARAPSTNKSYSLAYKRWRLWAQDYPEIRALPASHLHVLLYLVHLDQTATSFSTINLAVCAIKWAHGLAGLESPTDHVMITEALHGLRRKQAKPTVRKEPFTKDHIHQLISELDKCSVVELRNTVLIVLAYFALLRVSELLQIRACDVLILQDRLELVIPTSKCDQLRSGSKVLVAKLGGAFCPVELLCSYLNAVNINVFSDTYDSQFIFRRVVPSAGSFVLSKNNVPMTYSRVREVVKEKAKQIGLDGSLFSTHSMRAGGATSAARAGVSERCLQRHGRWATSSSKNRYIEDSIDSQLSVSKVLG
jgi:site-specific recombinase XerD